MRKFTIGLLLAMLVSVATIGCKEKEETKTTTTDTGSGTTTTTNTTN